MKNWHYIMIFVVIFVTVGGLLLYYASTVYDVPSEMTVVTESQNVTKKDGKITKEEESINILTDDDFEADEFDFTKDINVNDFDNVNGIIDVDDESVEF